MAVTQLATVTDVAAVLGRSLTSTETTKAGPILDKASELFRMISGQKFTPSTTSTVRIRNRSGIVTLPQRPVTGVAAVTHDDGTSATFTWVSGRVQFEVASDAKYVTVTYTHGGTVPDLVRLTVAEICKKVLEIDPSAAAGKTTHMETTGPFTEQETYAAWAQGAQTMLSPSDEAIARSYRIPIAGPIFNT